MSKLMYGTTWISEDEKCIGLYEIHEQSPGSRGFHRYQIIHVMRDDHIAEYREDLGPARKFRKFEQFRIPGGAKGEDGKYYIEETVGSLREIANQLRMKPLFDKRELLQLDKVND